VEIGTEAALFTEKEYIYDIFVAVCCKVQDEKERGGREGNGSVVGRESEKIGSACFLPSNLQPGSPLTSYSQYYLVKDTVQKILYHHVHCAGVHMYNMYQKATVSKGKIIL
jgi:hypothetical protein